MYYSSVIRTEERDLREAFEAGANSRKAHIDPILPVASLGTQMEHGGKTTASTTACWNKCRVCKNVSSKLQTDSNVWIANSVTVDEVDH
jgi:hypothetical protein